MNLYFGKSIAQKISGLGVYMMFYIGYGLVLLLSFNLRGENLYPKMNISQTALSASVRTKPSLKQDASTYKWDNTVSLGYKFSPDTLLSYNQDFSIAPTATSDMAFLLKNGVLRLSNGNLWSSKDKLTAFSDDFEIYFPLEEAKRDAGMILILRNDFQFLRKISNSVSITFSDAPVLHLYSDDGFFDGEKFITNPIFENQFILGFEVKISQSATFSFPLMYFTTLNRDYDDRAELNGSWEYYLGVGPNIALKLSDNVKMGIGYDSSNFIADTDYGPTLGDGFNSGSFWFSLKISI